MPLLAVRPVVLPEISSFPTGKRFATKRWFGRSNVRSRQPVARSNS